MEYRVCWSVNGNIRDDGGWHHANEGETASEIEDSLMRGGPLSDGLEDALQESGFEWWIETRGGIDHA